MTTKELVTIGQVWERNRGKELWRAAQVWRADRQALLRSLGKHERKIVPFKDLRKYYTLVE